MLDITAGYYYWILLLDITAGYYCWILLIDSQHLNTPLPTVQEMALRAAFSKGSPTSSPSNITSALHEDNTHSVSNGASFTATNPNALGGVASPSSPVLFWLQSGFTVYQHFSGRASMLPAQACDALNNKVISGQGTRLVKTADIHFASKWDPEGFSAIDTCVCVCM